MVRNTSFIMFFLNRDCINNCILYFITYMYNNMLVDIHVIYLIWHPRLHCVPYPVIDEWYMTSIPF